MEIQITFYFDQLDYDVRCMCMLNKDIEGIGDTCKEAKEDWIEKFNVWSLKMKEEAEKNLTKNGAVYTTKNIKFIEQ